MTTVHLRLRKLVDETTGELVAAFVPATASDRAILRDKGFRLNDRVKAKLTTPRNPGFHNMIHALGRLLTENVEAFSGLSSHDAVKRLQLESGAECDEKMMDIAGVKCLVKTPRSIAFDAMDEVRFRQLVSAMLITLQTEYMPSATVPEIEAMLEKIE